MVSKISPSDKFACDADGAGSRDYILKMLH